MITRLHHCVLNQQTHGPTHTNYVTIFKRISSTHPNVGTEGYSCTWSLSLSRRDLHLHKTQQTNIHVPGSFRTLYSSNREAAHLRLSPYWQYSDDWHGIRVSNAFACETTINRGKSARICLAIAVIGFLFNWPPVTIQHAWRGRKESWQACDVSLSSYCANFLTC